MRLLFPNEEHAPVELGEGTLLVGSGAECALRLTTGSVAAQHCELITEGEQTRVRPLTQSSPTVLNGKQIAGEAVIKPGDLLLFDKIGCRVAGGARLPPAAPRDSSDDDMGHTRVRMAMPKYLLRGVSGPTFGKIYAMVGTLAVGRSSDSDICIPIDEISRHHARLQNSAGGVVVEDLGSANGTFVNDQRIHTGAVLKPGDEVRFDTVRFLLMAPGEVQHAGSAARAEPAPASNNSNRALWIAAGVAVLIALVLAVLRARGVL